MTAEKLAGYRRTLEATHGVDDEEYVSTLRIMCLELIVELKDTRAALRKAICDGVQVMDEGDSNGGRIHLWSVPVHSELGERMWFASRNDALSARSKEVKRRLKEAGL